jgi:hypothetical protein
LALDKLNPGGARRFAVKKKPFLVEQIVATLTQIALGMPVAAASTTASEVSLQ